MNEKELLHGSPKGGLKVLQPKRPGKGQPKAVYATKRRGLATAFSIKDLGWNNIRRRGNNWTIANVSDKQLNTPGYIYHLPSRPFEQYEGWQYINENPTRPKRVEKVNIGEELKRLGWKRTSRNKTVPMVNPENPVHKQHRSHRNPGAISQQDKVWVQRVLMPYFGIKHMWVSWSDSQAKYPDIWCEKGPIPRITVTREWARQPTDERRKRLVHEALHIAEDLEHGMHHGMKYSSYPDKDDYSWAIYGHMMTLVRSRRWPNPTLAIPVRSQKQMAHLFKAQEHLSEAGVNFDTGTKMTYPMERHWELDWSLKGAKLKSNPSKPHYEKYLEQIRKRWDWPGIAKVLDFKERTRLPGDDSEKYVYLGSYLNFGPDYPHQEYYSHVKNFHTSIYNARMASQYRLGQWFYALDTVAEEHGLDYVMFPEDPTDIYIRIREKKRGVESPSSRYFGLGGW